MLLSVTKPPALQSYLIAVNIWLLFLTKYCKGYHIKLYEMRGARDSHGGKKDMHTYYNVLACLCLISVTFHMYEQQNKKRYEMFQN